MDFFFKAFASLFIIMGPFSIVPVFISLTDGYSKSEKNLIIKKAVLTGSLICLFFMITGKYIFAIFGFSIHSFRTAGGILLLLMSISMLQAQRSRIRMTEKEHLEGKEREDVSVFPLAIPIIAGPGTISTVILLVGEIDYHYQWASLVLALSLSAILITIILSLSDRLYRILGTTGFNILTRIMGLILAAISVEYIFQGVKSFFLFTPH